MDTLHRIESWLVAAGLAGATETELLNGFCDRCLDAGIALSRTTLLVDTLHPTHEGHAFRWRADSVEQLEAIEYGPSNVGESAASWLNSTFYRLVETGEVELRRKIVAGGPLDFAILREMRDEGQTDYVAFVHRFGATSVIGEMDCVYSSWATSTPDGFRDDRPRRAAAPRSAARARRQMRVAVAHRADARRGVSRPRRRPSACSPAASRAASPTHPGRLWFSDLRGYTRITDTSPPDEIIPLLNDYAEAVISAVHVGGGDVLKLIGDGVLAIFRADDAAEACRSALRAVASLKSAARRSTKSAPPASRPVTSVYLGLHLGEVFYGNIGSEDRLDFTVVGPAVNEASRIAAMCRSVDRGVVLSSEFVAATPEPERSKLVSVGRYALRGVGRAAGVVHARSRVVHLNEAGPLS